ncbi:hypothetical protein QJS10_CPA16g00657 [Acorus calamus]|uniref:Uncharacterized protein n=1 Tax=Acorus calamus TaxID=4465 RepID=A0AAV9CZP1_ACOCL|nr:hypothetical protein QJS10_CPA16g00657 [Acorus calamus]
MWDLNEALSINVVPRMKLMLVDEELRQKKNEEQKPKEQRPKANENKPVMTE